MTEQRLALTPAEHRLQAEADLRAMRRISPGEQTAVYSALAQSAIAHVLAAVAYYLDPDLVAEPEVRLPGGRAVRARQSEAGDRKWGYVVTAADGRTPQFTSERYMWATAETALAAGTAAWTAQARAECQLSVELDGHEPDGRVA